MYEYAVPGDLSKMQKDDPAAMQKTLNEMAQEGWRLTSTVSVVNNAASYIYMFFERARS